MIEVKITTLCRKPVRTTCLDLPGWRQLKSQLRACCEDGALSWRSTPARPPVEHGKGGVWSCSLRDMAFTQISWNHPSQPDMSSKSALQWPHRNTPRQALPMGYSREMNQGYNPFALANSTVSTNVYLDNVWGQLASSRKTCSTLCCYFAFPKDKWSCLLSFAI